MHPLNIQAKRVLKAAKIPTYPDQMPISTLMLWILEDGDRAAQLPMMEDVSSFQERYLDLEEAVRDLDQHNPEALLALVEDHEGEVALAAEHLKGLGPEEMGLRLLEELNYGMALHPERYQ